jgi:hypothetical protein
MSDVIQVDEDMRANRALSYGSGVSSRVQEEDRFEPPQSMLRTGLESCGLAADDTAVLLNGLAAGLSLEEVARQISTGQILTKRTAHGRRHVLTAIKRRYIEAPHPLPHLSELATILPVLTSQVAKSQILLPYLLLSDRLAFEITMSIVLPARQHGEEQLRKDRVLAALSMAFRRHGRKPWGHALCVRWVEGLLSVLRDIGMLGSGAERETLLLYTVRPEVFSFHLWGLYENGLRGRALYTTCFWRLLLLAEQEAQHLMTVVAERGWWRLTTLGAAEEVLSAFRSVHEWINHELG